MKPFNAADLALRSELARTISVALRMALHMDLSDVAKPLKRALDLMRKSRP